MLRWSTLLICLFALALPVVAHAQSAPSAPQNTQSAPPLPPLLPSQSQTPAVTATTSTNTNDDGLAAWQQLLLVASGGILLLGIAWLIVRDARDVAPTITSEEQVESRERQEADVKRRKAKNRAAAKRSRTARKRNR